MERPLSIPTYSQSIDLFAEDYADPANETTNGDPTKRESADSSTSNGTEDRTSFGTTASSTSSNGVISVAKQPPDPVDVMEVSDNELRQEISNLRDLRRRSVTVTNGIDPDLPHERTQSTRRELSSDDPSHLFWVPAGVHPEIAPQEFKEFLRTHARKNSIKREGDLSRKKSMLSQQYRPMENDGVGQQTKVSTRRKKTRMGGPEMTLADLQKLEELAEEATESDDPTKLRTILRRSLSLNISPQAASVLVDKDEEPNVDQPIIVPLPGQILRRTARTKIRKPSLLGDGGGHRFPAHRRTGSMRDELLTSPVSPPTESAPASSDKLEKMDLEESIIQSPPHIEDVRTPSPSTSGFSSISQSPPLPENAVQRVRSQETLARVQSSPSALITTEEEPLLPEPVREPVVVQEVPLQDSHLIGMDPPVADVSPQSPSDVRTQLRQDIRPPPPRQPISQPQAKKAGWSWKIFSSNDEEEMKPAKQKGSSSKEPGLFQSLFSKKAKNDNAGASNSLYQPPISSLIKNKKYTNYNRLPIHVERAIYRLSHIKLTNPRRPLCEQVLISNLMFWYLSVINRAATSNPPPQVAPAPQPQPRPEPKTGLGGKFKKGSLKVPESRRRPNSSAEGYAIRPVKYDVQQKQLMKQHRPPRPTTPPLLGQRSPPRHNSPPHGSPPRGQARHSSPPRLPNSIPSDTFDVILGYTADGENPP